MIHKIVGETGAGHGACGCRIKAGEAYFIKTEGKSLKAYCKKHAGNTNNYKLLRVPRDYVDCVLPIH